MSAYSGTLPAAAPLEWDEDSRKWVPRQSEDDLKQRAAQSLAEILARSDKSFELMNDKAKVGMVNAHRQSLGLDPITGVAGEQGLAEWWRGKEMKGLLPLYTPIKNIMDMKALKESVSRIVQQQGEPEDWERLVGAQEQQLRDLRGRSFAADVGEIGFESVPFMLEFLIGSGILKGGKAVLSGAGRTLAAGALERQAIKGGLRKALRFDKALGAVPSGISRTAAGAAARTALMPHRIYEQAELHTVPGFLVGANQEGDLRYIETRPGGDFYDALPAAIKDIFIENFTELSGAGISKMTGAAKRKISNMVAESNSNRLRSLKVALASEHARRFSGSWQKTMAQLRRFGFHGIIEEVGEERLGEIMRWAPLIGTDADYPDLQEMAMQVIKEGIAFSLFPGGMAIAREIAGLDRPSRAELAELGIVIEDQESRQKLHDAAKEVLAKAGEIYQKPKPEPSTALVPTSKPAEKPKEAPKPKPVEKPKESVQAKNEQKIAELEAEILELSGQKPQVLLAIQHGARGLQDKEYIAALEKSIAEIKKRVQEPKELPQNHPKYFDLSDHAIEHLPVESIEGPEASQEEIDAAEERLSGGSVEPVKAELIPGSSPARYRLLEGDSTILAAARNRWQTIPAIVMPGAEHRRKQVEASVSGVVGHETEIQVPEGSPVRSRYEIRELESLQTSHTIKNGKPYKNSNYKTPELQPRAYEPGSSEHHAVLDHERLADPRYWVSDHPGADSGPPSVTPDGQVINGHSRVMSLQHAKNIGNYGWYKDFLKEKAENFGTDSAEVEKMKHPALVRVVDMQADSPAAHAFARLGNIALQQKQTPVREAGSLMGAVDMNLLADLPLGEDTTFGQAVTGNTAAAKNFRKSLKDKVPSSVQPEIFRDDGNLTNKGVELLKNMLLLNAFSVEMVESVNRNRPGIANNIQAATPQLLKIKRDFADERNLVPQLEEAVWFMINNPEVQYVTSKNQSAEKLRSRIDHDILAQGELIPGTAPQISPGGRMMLDWLIARGNSPVAMRKDLARVAADLEQAGGLFAAEEVPYPQALGQILNVPVRGDAEFGVGERERDRYAAGGETAAMAEPSREEYEPREAAPAGQLGFEQRQTLRHVPMPELVQFAKEILQSTPKLRKLRKNLGIFKSREDLGWGEIIIDPRQSPEQLAEVLAHELGHAVDFQGLRKTLSRGNLIGRLLTLRKFMKKTFGDLEDKELREELIELSYWWRPVKGSADGRAHGKHRKYRESSRELYADALSVWLRSPGDLADRAPSFWQAFAANIDRKPGVVDAYMDIQSLLNRDPASLAQRRRENIHMMFAAGREKARAYAEAKRAAQWSIGEHLKQFLSTFMLDRFVPAKDAVRGGDPRGWRRDYSNRKAAEYLVDELYMQNSDSRLLIETFDREIKSALRQAGISDDLFGEYLYLRRVLGGDRKSLGNPLGHDQGSAREQIRSLRNYLGRERYNRTRQIADRFHELVFAEAERAAQVGTYSQEAFETIIRPNKRRYSAFAVAKYIDDYVSPYMKQQIGTFEDIGNPLTFTVMKVLALRRLNNLIEAKNAVLDVMLSEPQNAPKNVPIPYKHFEPTQKPAPGMGFLITRVDGKQVAYEVPLQLARAFNGYDLGAITRYARLMQSWVYKAFHPLFVTFSPSFLVANPFRDLRRSWVNLGAIGKALQKRSYDDLIARGTSREEALRLSKQMKITLWDVLKNAFGSIPEAHRRFRGKPDAVISQMLQERVLGIPYTEVEAEIQNLVNLGETLDKRSVPQKFRDSKFKAIRGFGQFLSLLKYTGVGHVLHGLRWAAEIQETATKVGAWKLLNERGLEPRERAYIVRKYVGTPDWSQQGQVTPLTNSLFMYSKVRWNGLQADLGLAFNKDTGWAWWWRQVVDSLLPTTWTRAALYGVLGPELAKMFAMIPSYFLQDYDVFPLGLFTDDDGEEKVKFVTLPKDDVGRFLSNVFGRTIDLAVEMAGGETREESAAKVFHSLLGEAEDLFLPSFNPIVDIGDKWLQFARGVNPYDSYFNEPIIPRSSWTAGGWKAARKLMAWSIDKTGSISAISHWATAPILGEWFDETKEHTLEYRWRSVGKATGIGRLFRISNRGKSEKEWNEIDAEDRERERFKIRNVGPHARNMARDRNKLNLMNEEKLSAQQRIERRILNNWYGNRYLELTKQIEQHESAGRPEQAKEVSDVLNAEAEDMILNGYANERGMLVVATILDDPKPRAGRDYEKRLKRWNRDQKAVVNWIKDNGHNPRQIMRLFARHLIALHNSKKWEARTVKRHYKNVARKLEEANLMEKEESARIFREETRK